MGRRPDEEEQQRREAAAPGSFMLFGTVVRVAGDEEEDDGEPVEMKKSSSVPNLTSINPLLLPGEGDAGKAYASDDGDLASPQQKRRRRKAHERKKGGSLSFSIRFLSPLIENLPRFRHVPSNLLRSLHMIQRFIRRRKEMPSQIQR